jgi:hypothetical protein
MTRHIDQVCDIKDCRNNAEYWIDSNVLGISMSQDTFYLCDDHMTTLSEDGETIKQINPETLDVDEIEIASYACSDTCDVCNN